MRVHRREHIYEDTTEVIYVRYARMMRRARDAKRGTHEDVITTTLPDDVNIAPKSAKNVIFIINIYALPYVHDIIIINQDTLGTEDGKSTQKCVRVRQTLLLHDGIAILLRRKMMTPTFIVLLRAKASGRTLPLLLCLILNIASELY